jgi:hypothetical protein
MKTQLKETDGFDKKQKETNVGEDLRNNYETGKLVPYQSVIAEGKIVVKPKLEEAKGPNSKSEMTEANFKQKIDEYIDNTLDYAESHDGYELDDQEKLENTLRQIIWNLITESQDELYDEFTEELN